MNTSKNILNKSTVLQKQETHNTYHRAITKQSLKCKVGVITFIFFHVYGIQNNNRCGTFFSLPDHDFDLIRK